MGGIASQENSTAAKFRNLAMGNVKARKPDRVTETYPRNGPPVHDGLDLIQLRFTSGSLVRFLPNIHEYSAAVAAEREYPDQSIASQEQVNVYVIQWTINHRVGKEKRLGIGISLKPQT